MGELDSINWKIMVYIAVDNELDSYGVKNYYAIRTEGASENLFLSVEMDKAGKSGSLRFESQNSQLVRVEKLEEQDSGSSDTLLNFVNWSNNRHTADKTMLILSSHGYGFKRPFGQGMHYDENGAGAYMFPSDIRKVLTIQGYVEDKPLEILVFDSCMMGMVEVAYEFLGVVKNIVASQTMIPGAGCNYGDIVNRGKMSLTEKAFSSYVVDGFIEKYYSHDKKQVSLSSIDVSKTKTVIDSLSVLGYALMGIDIRHLNALRQEMESLKTTDYVDIVQMARLLEGSIDSADVKGLAGILIDAIEEGVIKHGSHQIEAGMSNGLSVWFPQNKEKYEKNLEDYKRLRCNDAGFGWNEFLGYFHS